MKKHIISILFVFITMGLSAQITNTDCCPEFKLIDKSLNRQCCSSIEGNPCKFLEDGYTCMCRFSTNSFLVVPNQNTFTYTWEVTGGTSVSLTGNPLTITWGGGLVGTIKVTITNADSSCYQVISKKYCLIPAPNPDFTFNPNNSCAGTPIQFENTSTGGSHVSWNFGDGSTAGNVNNPIHSYSTPGDYVVTLTVCNDTALCPDQSPNGVINYRACCGCCTTKDTIINVTEGSALTINPNDCNKCLCPGDTAVYCANPTNANCSFTWFVEGGIPIGSINQPCIKVKWTGPYPTKIILNASGSGCNTCNATATLNVPVLLPNLPILPNNHIACAGSLQTYYLPEMPGTFYSWSILPSTSGTIVGYSNNTSSVVVQWGNGSSGTVSCLYNNNYLNPSNSNGCQGSSILNVQLKPVLTLTGTPSVCEGGLGTYNASGQCNWTVTPNTGFSMPSGPSTSKNITWNSAGNYQITVTPVISSAFCTPSATFNVVVNPKPILTITGETTICPNSIYNYIVTSNVDGGTINWSFLSGSGTSSPYGENNSNSSVSFTGNGPWTLKVEQTVNGCTGSATLNVSKVAAPPPISLSQTNICSGGSVTASVSGSIPPGGYIWSCTPGAVLTSGQGTTTANFIINDDADITITNCVGNNTQPVTVNNSTVTITSTVSTCSATLAASPGGGTCNWFLNGASIGNGNPISVTQNGSYVLQTTYSNGCTATDSENVTGINQVVASISATGNLCNNGIVTLQALVNANCPGASYTWSNGATGNPITVNSPGSYSVTVDCSNGCSDISNVITVQPCSTGSGNCINDLIISGNNNCSNPVSLTASVPGCTPTGTTWYFGDGSTGSSGSHQYSNAGTYTVYAVMTCSNGTVHCGSQIITIPLVVDFTKVTSCGTNSWNIQLQDASLFIPTYTGYTRTWTTTCGTLSATNTSNTTLNVPYGCNPTVTLTISKNGCTISKSFTFNLPTATLSIIGSASVCNEEINSFSCSTLTGVLSYSWDFGDGTTGVTNPISHAYNGTPSNPVITLNITDQNGCVFTASKNITVKTPPQLTITPTISVCQDCPPNSSLVVTSGNAGSFNNFQWYHNDVAIPGATNSSYLLCTFNATGNYYLTAVHQSTGCSVKSNVSIVTYKPKPVANIVGSSVLCISGNSGQFSVQNSNHLPGYSYNWQISPGGTILPQNSNQPTVTVSASSTPYQITLTVTDNNGCTSTDCLVVYVSEKPTAQIPPSGLLCEGNNNILTVNPSTGYGYLWNTGATTSSISAISAGYYHATVVDLESGCSATATGFVNKAPNVNLFPACCDTICDTALVDTNFLIPPLPTNFPPPYFSNYAGLYTIKWFDNGNLIHTGGYLPLSVFVNPYQYGLHEISIQVSFTGQNCISTSGTYNLYIDTCKNCCPKAPNWKNIQMSFGNTTINWPDCDLNNPTTYHPECNEEVNFTAIYNDCLNNCTGKVKYTLGLLNQSPFQSGYFNPPGNSISFIPQQNATTVLWIYAMCDNDICDSCVYWFVPQCIDTLCCPQMSQISIRNTNENLSQQPNNGNGYSLFITQVSIAGGTTPYTEVRATLMDFELSANYNDCISCSNYPFTYASLSATPLAGIQPVITLPSSGTGYQVPSNIYGNPREVVWNNNNTPIDLSSPQNSTLSFYLPPESSIPCCLLKAKICVKFSLYDINCNLCEIDTCYEVMIGDTTVHESCCCEKWTTNALTVIRLSAPYIKVIPKKVECGGSMSGAPGQYTINAPPFICSPATCNTTYQWVITRKNWALSGHPMVAGTGTSLTYDFTETGAYFITFIPMCGTCKCEPCKIILYIENQSTDCKCKGLITHDMSFQWKDPEIKTGTANCPNDVDKVIDVICKNTQITGNFFQYGCNPADCNVKYNWKIIYNDMTEIAGDTESSSTNFYFTPNLPGEYELWVTPICGGENCEDVCAIAFVIKNIKQCL